MSRYNPFAEKAGMKKVAEKIPDPKLMELKNELERLGFNPQLLNSTKYNTKRLQRLKKHQLNIIRGALVRSHHFFLLKNVLTDKEYSSKQIGEKEKWAICERKIRKASIEKLTKLISIVARLIQVKVYLIWSRGETVR